MEPAQQSLSSRLSVHCYRPFRLLQDGWAPPQGEHVGPQNSAELHAAHSVTSLQAPRFLSKKLRLATRPKTNKTASPVCLY